jgi:hypothetical protein
MINANELRIGNWVKHLPNWSYRNDESKEFYFQWDDSDWYKIGESCISLSDIEPILLTEEILLKCGFQHHKYANDESFFEMQISKDIFLNYSPFHCRYILRKQWYGNIYNGNIEHLHQLQNLYFALTKTELEVNL